MSRTCGATSFTPGRGDTCPSALSPAGGSLTHPTPAKSPCTEEPHWSAPSLVRVLATGHQH